MDNAPKRRQADKLDEIRQPGSVNWADSSDAAVPGVPLPEPWITNWSAADPASREHYARDQMEEYGAACFNAGRASGDAPAAPASAGNPSTAGAELHIGVSNNDQGVHINIMQQQADGTATVIYTARAPAGDSYGRARLAAPVAQSTAGAAKGELSDEAIDEVWDAMPGGADGWLKQFGYFQFARAIARHVLVRVAASMAGTIRPTDDELWEQTIGERDHYHDMADKLAEAIGKHFGIEIGEHSNMNCPWHTALDWIKNTTTVAEMRLAAPAAQAPAPTAAEVRKQALEEAAQACENERVEDTGTDGDTGYNNAITHCAAAIRALRTASKDQSSALGEKGGDDSEQESRADEDWFFHPND